MEEKMNVEIKKLNYLDDGTIESIRPFEKKHLLDISEKR